MKNNVPGAAVSIRCQFTFADGRCCRMPRHADHSSLCLFHAREELQLREAQRLGAEISASLNGDFLTATDINHVLGKLFTALAQNRVSSRNAATLAYIGQLLLQSLPNVKKEFEFNYDFNSWNQKLAEATPLSDPPSAPAPALLSSATPAEDS